MIISPNFNSAANCEEYDSHEGHELLELVPTSIYEDYIDELLCAETSSEGSCCSYTDLFNGADYAISNVSLDLAFSQFPPSAAPSHCDLQSSILAWSDATGLPATVSVHVARKVFKLHKFPMVSLCGYLKRELMEVEEVHLDKGSNWWPGGAESFEIVANFCYGGRVALSPTNVAAIRCAAEVLEMSEEYTQGNLAQRCDVYLRHVALRRWSHAILVLQQCQSLHPLADSLLIVAQCVHALATMACGQAANAVEIHPLDDARTASFPASFFPASCESAHSIRGTSKCAVEVNDCSFCYSLEQLGDDQLAWIHDLVKLPPYHFSPIVLAAHRLGMRDEHIALTLLQYAENAIFSCFEVMEDGALKKKQRTARALSYSTEEFDGNLQDEIIEKIEAVIALLQEALSCSLDAERKERFPRIRLLFGLLKCAHACSGGMGSQCKLESMIEKRLKNAKLSDFELPCSLSAGDAAEGEGSHCCSKKARVHREDQKRRRDQKEVESMLHIFSVFFTRLHMISVGKHEAEGAREGQEQEAAQVTELWDAYMAEAAAQPELTVRMFLEMAEVVPSSARHSHDRLYAAVDCFLQSHPSVSPQERQAACKVLNCQKLSQDCCIQAVQNETLPLRIIVQAMFMHQLNTTTTTTTTTPATRATPVLERSASCYAAHKHQDACTTPSPTRKKKPHQLAAFLTAARSLDEHRQPKTGVAALDDTEVLHTRLLTLEDEIQQIKRSLSGFKLTNDRPPSPPDATQARGWRRRFTCLGLLRHASSPHLAPPMNRLPQQERRSIHKPVSLSSSARSCCLAQPCSSRHLHSFLTH